MQDGFLMNGGNCADHDGFGRIGFEDDREVVMLPHGYTLEKNDLRGSSDLSAGFLLLSVVAFFTFCVAIIVATDTGTETLYGSTDTVSQTAQVSYGSHGEHMEQDREMQPTRTGKSAYAAVGQEM